jgi:hypothetical protein
MDAIVKFFKRFAVYTTIGLAGAIFIFKNILNTNKKVDKNFMTKSKKQNLSKLKFSLYQFSLSEITMIKLAKIFKREKNHSFNNINEKKQKMTTYIENILKPAEKNTQLESHNNENLDEEEKIKNNNKAKESKVLDKRDRMFFALFQSLSKVIVDNQ